MRNTTVRKLTDLQVFRLNSLNSSCGGVPPYVVSSRAPSVQHSRALRAAALFANSTIPFPVGQSWSSVTTMARSTGPNWEKAWRKGLQQEMRGLFMTVVLGIPGPAHLFQQLVGHRRQQVPHRERSAVDGEADPDGSLLQHRPVQLSFSYFCKCPGFLQKKITE